MALQSIMASFVPCFRACALKQHQRMLLQSINLVIPRLLHCTRSLKITLKIFAASMRNALSIITDLFGLWCRKRYSTILTVDFWRTASAECTVIPAARTFLLPSPVKVVTSAQAATRNGSFCGVSGSLKSFSP